MDKYLQNYSGPKAKRPASDAEASSSSDTKSKPKPAKPTPWVEKYRPLKLDDIAHQEEVVSVLKKCLQGGDLPNFLFYGSPGTGKTSAALALARELFGHELMRDRVLELNASDERGISVIREKVKRFAQLTANAKRPDGLACPPVKLIILDEADNMTSAAQSALRRTMEVCARSTRFCLICNYVSRIIPPISSRCAKFRFRPLPPTAVQARVEQICSAEGLEVAGSEFYDSLVDLSGGDLRRALTLLHSAARFAAGDQLQPQLLHEIAGSLSEPTLKPLLLAIQSGSCDAALLQLRCLLLDGYAGEQILLQLHQAMLPYSDDKPRFLQQVAIAERALIDGADEYLQISAVCVAAIGG